MMLIPDLFLLRVWPFRHACEHPRASLWVTAFIAATGVLYGTLVALFQRAIGADVGGHPVAEIPSSILYGGNIVAGLIVTVAVHVGITLVAWLMARAIGGPGLLVGLYRTTAYLLALGWPAVPQIALTVAAAGRAVPPLPADWAYLPLAGIGLALFFAGLYQIYVLTQEKGPARSAFAVVMFAIFVFAVFLVL
ncbi:MAG: hypothetical protein ACFCUO_13420 [Rhodospirillales bacterium]